MPPRVDFVPERQRCVHCGRPLSPQKSKTRRLVTLAAGTLRAHEIRRQCRVCPSGPVAVSGQLAGLAPAGQRYGWDLIVWVGLARYHRHLQREEIRAALARQGLCLAAGSVSALCDRFLASLEALHWHCAPALWAVLHAVRIGSENERELRPALERTVAAFGDSVAIMCDLGKAGTQAVADCRQRGVPDLLCQYHFLAAVGHRLLDGDYALLRGQIARSRVRARLRALLRAARADPSLRPDLPALLLWILEAEGRKHLSFPFSLPHRGFHHRCEQFPAERDRRLQRPRSRSELRLRKQAAEALRALERPDPQGLAISRLERGWTLFCELRDVLRLSAEAL